MELRPLQRRLALHRSMAGLSALGLLGFSLAAGPGTGARPVAFLLTLTLPLALRAWAYDRRRFSELAAEAGASEQDSLADAA